MGPGYAPLCWTSGLVRPELHLHARFPLAFVYIAARTFSFFMMPCVGLQPPYDDRYNILQGAEKRLTLQIEGCKGVVSLDRLQQP